MKVNVTIKAQQILEKQTNVEVNECKGEMISLEKGEILEFVEKHEEKTLHFKMMITKEKIISIREGQRMVFNLKKDDTINYETPYGAINMKIHTESIQIKREKGELVEILLAYTIEMEKQERYLNKIEIKIKEC